MSPTFSVVIPLYNKAEFIRRAVTSVLEQSDADLEVVVINDGSTDGSADVARAIADPRVRVVDQSNAGVAAARNRGIAESVGQYVTFLDADDEYLPGFLASMRKLALKFPGAAMLCSGYQACWTDGRSQEFIRLGVPRGELGLVPDFYSEWSRKPFMSASSVAIPSETLTRAQLRFAVGEKLGEDQDLWFRLAELGPVAHVNQALARYWQAISNSATSSQVVLNLLPCYDRLQKRLEADLVPPTLRPGAQRLLASHILNVARANHAVGRNAVARRLAFSRLAFGNASYWLRTALLLLTSRARTGDGR